MWDKGNLCLIVASILCISSCHANKSTGQTSSKPALPNILLIMVDDLGHDDLSVHNHPTLKTPSIDSLAAESVRFSDFTVTPVCSTTRAALMTGRHPYKTGVSGVHGGRDFLNKDEILISQHLKKAGYQTGIWGKWHSGKTSGYLPWDRGYDDAYYAELYQHQNSFGWHNGKYVEHSKWVSEVITDYTIDFINQSNNKPFFAYASYLAPHEPWIAPEHYVQKYLNKGYRPALANLYGMIEEMDTQVGRLIQHLEATGKRDNTLIIFLSDNGPWWDSSNYGAMTKKEWHERNPSELNGNKGQTWQNGVKSPLFVSLPSRFKPALVRRYVDVKDILPTILEIAGSKPHQNTKPIGGQSFLTYLNGNIKGKNTRSTLIASHDLKSTKPLFNQWTPIDDVARANIRYEQQVISLRTESHKLILNPAMDHEHYPSPTGKYLLFDMQKDPLETSNIYNKAPEIAASMTKQLQTKFQNILDDVASFNTPIYVIDDDSPISIINGFGPSATSGNTKSRPHHLTSLKEKGDQAIYDLDVNVTGNYKLYITQDSTDSAGLLISIELGEQIKTIELDGSLQQYVGQFQVTPGHTKLKLSLLKNNSIKPWSAITKMRRLILVEEGREALLESHTHPY